MRVVMKSKIIENFFQPLWYNSKVKRKFVINILLNIENVQE